MTFQADYLYDIGNEICQQINRTQKRKKTADFINFYITCLMYQLKNFPRRLSSFS